jgi:hypothetical protein
MRNLLTSLGLCVAMSATYLPAQSPDPSVYEKDAATSRHMTAAEQRIYERASFEARERLARIESRHRNGISISRPAIYQGGFIVPDTLLVGPWHYYRGASAYPCP